MSIGRRISGDPAGAVSARLLSPAGAAAYLGLGSRWAIYRLVSNGQLPAVRLAGKLRIDRADLDRLIEAAKSQGVVSRGTDTKMRPVTPSVPRQLAPPPTRLTRPFGEPFTRQSGPAAK